MNDFVIYTDANCDLPASLVEEFGVEVLPMRFSVDGKEYYNWPDRREMSSQDFYKMLRAGAQTATTQTNTIEYVELFRPWLAKGQDVLYVGFSSGLSGTVNAAAMAIDQLKEEFPERTVIVVDTLSASVGQGLLVHKASDMKKAGKSMQEIADWLRENCKNVIHWVTVDDLYFLKRGGRLSGTAALMGTMLSIKPIINIDNTGKLSVVDKVRGRKNSLKRIVDEVEKSITNPEDEVVYIAHGDCIDDANQLVQDIKNRVNPKDVSLHFIGPVIGGHSGPNTLAVCFMGTAR